MSVEGGGRRVYEGGSAARRPLRDPGRCALPAGRLSTMAVTLLCVASLSCASTAQRSTPAATAAAATGGAPWDLPAGAVPSQRLYQGSYEGPEGGGSFRATLRLLASDRFRLDASDRLGRLLWTLGVDGGTAWWIDHRAGAWCPDLSRLALPGLGRGPVPPAAVPAMLLGALPARPASPLADAPQSDGELEIRDAAGRRWQATLAGGRVTTWTVAEDAQPVWWWRRQGRGGVLSQRQGRQLRWQEVVVEPLRGELPPRSVPAGYREACDELPPA
ncbi:MAG TPA: hypothetical protein VN923_17805 [Thermoanaerobaculia bacterium]|nr:hypothetical protein [Thermoanaerobaculia bacterium]